MEKVVGVNDYQVGGSLPMDTPSYVVRSADCQLYQELKQGEFCYIFDSRQMGKSSLMVRIMHRLRKDGYCCTAVDMTRIGGERITPEQWYKGLIIELLQGFNLFGKINFKSWWSKYQNLSPVQILSIFIEEILLVETSNEESESDFPLVIFFDEIDSVLSLDFSVNDFFALIRFCYNQRSLNPKYNRLTFVLLGVATPSRLINDFRRTPFNIGKAIQLNGFELHEAKSLLSGLNKTFSSSNIVLKEILHWTHGQPFLTQKICQLVSNFPPQTDLNNENDQIEWIEQLIQTRVINNWQTQDEPEHLKTICDRLLNNEKRINFILASYQQILREQFILAENSEDQQELILSGLIIREGDKLKVRNLIYQKVFNLSWVEKQLSQLRPYAESLKNWQKSDYTDTSRLLRGKALEDAQEWAFNKTLSNIDYSFLASSEQLNRKEIQLNRKEIQQSLEAERAKEIETRLFEKQKTAQLQRYFLITLSVALISVLGFGLFAKKQYHQANLNEIQATTNYSEALFASNKRLEALITAIKVKRQWQKLNYDNQSTDEKIESLLRQAVYGLEEYNRLSGHTAEIFGVDISPDCQRIVTASSDKNLKLWSSDGALLNTFEGHQAPVWDVSFSPDGNLVASASRDKTVKLWNSDGEIINTLNGHQDEVLGVGFSPDGNLVASASRDKTVKLWNPDGEIIDTLNGHQSSVWKAVFSFDGQMIATASEDQTVKLWKLDDQGEFQLEQTLRGHTSEIRDVAFSPDGKTIVSVSNDHTARIWQLDEGKLLHTLEGHSAPVVGVVFKPDNQIIFTASWDGSIKLWNLQGALLKTIKIDDNRIWDIDISHNGEDIASASGQDIVKLAKLDNPLLTVLRHHSAPIIDIAFNPQAKTIVTASDDHTVKFWNHHGSLLTTFKSQQDSVLGIAWSQDGKQLISGHWDGSLNFLQVKDLNQPKVYLNKTIKGHNVGAWQIAVSPNGQMIATVSEDKTAKLWDWHGNLITTMTGHQDVVRGVTFSADSKMIATASPDETIKLWDTQGNNTHTLTDHKTSLVALDFSPDGKILVTADLEGVIKLWQINHEQGRVSIRLHKTLKGNDEGVSKVIFSHDSKLFATANEDATITLWHRNGKPLKTLYGHNAKVWSISFSSDNKTLASASEDKTAIVWNIQQMFELDLLTAGCDLIDDYLRTNSEVSSSERLLCSNIEDLQD